MNSSCYGCKNRHYLCHKGCEIYNKYKEQLDVIKKNKECIVDKYIHAKNVNALKRRVSR